MTSTDRFDVSAIASEAVASFDRVVSTAASTVDRGLYGLVRRHVATLLRIDDPTPGAGGGDGGVAADATATVCLAFAEQFVLDVAAVSDEQRAALAAALGEQAAPLAQTLYAIDFELRLRAAFRQLTGADPLAVGPTATDGRPLWPVLEDMLTAVARLRALDPMTTELVRLRGARSHNCRFCQSLRNVRAVESGGDEQHFDKVDRFEQSDLPEQHKVALRLTDALIWQPGAFPEGLVDEVHLHFSPAQVVELVFDVARNALNKFAVAVGVDGEGVGDGLGYYDTAESGELVYGLTPAT